MSGTYQIDGTDWIVEQIRAFRCDTPYDMDERIVMDYKPNMGVIDALKKEEWYMDYWKSFVNTPSSRAQKVAALTGRTFSDEHKQHLREARLRYHAKRRAQKVDES